MAPPEKPQGQESTPPPEKMDQWKYKDLEGQVNGFVGTVQKDVNAVAEHFNMVPPIIDVTKFNDAGECTDKNLANRMEEKITNPATLAKVISMAQWANVLKSALRNFKDNEINLRDAIDESLIKIREASDMRFSREGDSMAGLSPTLDSGNLELRRHEVTEAEAKAKQIELLKAENERLSQGDAAPKEAITQIFSQDVNMGINAKKFTNAEELNLSPSLVENLRKYCQRTKEGVIMDIDLGEVGAQTIDETPIIEQSPGSKTIKVFVTPSKDGRFLQLSWDVRIPKQAGSVPVLHHNVLNIALDASAYQKTGEETSYEKPNLVKQATDENAEAQNEYVEQYKEAIAKLKEGRPGDRIVFQRPITESKGDTGTRSYTAEIVVVKMHAIDGRTDQYAVYRREVAPERTRYQKMNAQDEASMDNLPSLPAGSTEGRISMMESREATPAQELRGIARSYKVALEEFSSESSALSLNFRTDRSRFDKALENVFALVENYGVNGKTVQMLKNAGFKVEDIAGDEGRTIRVAMTDPRTKEVKSKEIEMAS